MQAANSEQHSDTSSECQPQLNRHASAHLYTCKQEAVATQLEECADSYPLAVIQCCPVLAAGSEGQGR